MYCRNAKKDLSAKNNMNLLLADQPSICLIKKIVNQSNRVRFTTLLPKLNNNIRTKAVETCYKPAIGNQQGKVSHKKFLISQKTNSLAITISSIIL
jgi:hypothetical protein